MIKIFVSYVIAIISHRVSVILSISIYAGLLVFSVHQSWQQPAANWDALPYTALALRWDGHSENELRTAALAEVRTAFPGHYDNFVSGGPADAYKQAVSTDDSSFFAQLPFYAIKPLYVAGVFLLGKLEGNFGIATAHLSALAFVFISFFAAMACPRGVPIVIWLTGLITVTSYIGPFPLTLLAAASTPDALSGALFLGAILLARKEKLGVATLLLLLSQLARPDAIVPIMTFLLALAVINPQRRLMLLTTAGMAIGVHARAELPSGSTSFHADFQTTTPRYNVSGSRISRILSCSDYLSGEDCRQPSFSAFQPCWNFFLAGKH